LDHLVHLSSQKKETKLQAQVSNVQIVLEAFGNARTSLNDNSSRFGKYVELQFNERGRMVGTKLLNYLLDKSRVTHCPGNEQTFHIFYQLIAGASAEEKSILQLDDEHQYHYIPRYMAAAGGEANAFKGVKQAMRLVGITKKYQARIWQLVACLLHLGELEFINDSSVQEAAFVKNTETLGLCADFLGVDPRALEEVLTYKTQMIKKDITTLILDAAGAGRQRDEIVQSLYSLLFTWLVEHMNTKLCTESVHSFIGILDLPGLRLSNGPADFNSFCVNIANERLQQFYQRTIFEVDTEDYRSEGLEVDDVPYFNNQACVELLTRHKHGLSELTNHHAKSSTATDGTMFDAYIKYNSNHDSFSIKSTDASQRLFAVQHFAGQVTYNPNGFLESNKDSLNPDLVQLIRGGDTTAASYNSFVLELFADNSVHTENHPKQKDAILNAQQPSGPLRGPSMRRSKSTKRARNSTLEPAVQPAAKKNVSMLLSQLNQSLDELFITLDETIPWFVFCIRPNDSSAPNQFDSSRVKSQIRAWGLPQICKRLSKTYTVSYFHDEFLERYETQLASIEKSGTPKEQCVAAVVSFGWLEKQACVGETKVIYT
jgi:chitin synthase